LDGGLSLYIKDYCVKQLLCDAPILTCGRVEAEQITMNWAYPDYSSEDYASGITTEDIEFYKLEFCQEGNNFGSPDCDAINSHDQFTPIRPLEHFKKYKFRVRADRASSCNAPGEWSDTVTCDIVVKPLIKDIKYEEFVLAGTDATIRVTARVPLEKNVIGGLREIVVYSDNDVESSECPDSIECTRVVNVDTSNVESLIFVATTYNSEVSGKPLSYGTFSKWEGFTVTAIEEIEIYDRIFSFFSLSEKEAVLKEGDEKFTL